MKKSDNDKVTYKCSICGRPIWVLESINRGMGPICYGRTKMIEKMKMRGMSQEEIDKLSRKVIKQYRRKQKKKIRIEKDKNQKTLDSFIVDKKENNEVDINNEIKKLRKELNSIWYNLSLSNGWGKSDRALKIIDKIKELESE